MKYSLRRSCKFAGRLCLAVCLCLLCLLAAGCGSEDRGHEGQTPVTFALEGGSYRNCTRPVVHYYDFGPGADRTICPLGGFAGDDDPVMIGYHVEGWYRTRTETGGTVTYADPWDFDRDTVGEEGVTLYARWVKNVSLTYEICYRDETSGETVVLGSYPTSEGEAFNPEYISDYAGRRQGYTLLPDEVYDAADAPWDPGFRHPGGDEDLAVQVFVHYVPGVYKVVHNASELRRALSSNIYLVADIDMGGADFGGSKLFSGILEGNGHTISHFNLSYGSANGDLVVDEVLDDEGGKVLAIGLFGSLSGATVSHVTFADFTVNIKTTNSQITRICVAPLALHVKDSTLSSVTVSMTLTLEKLPGSLTEDDVVVPRDDTEAISGWFSLSGGEAEDVTVTVR